MTHMILSHALYLKQTKEQQEDALIFVWEKMIGYIALAPYIIIIPK